MRPITRFRLRTQYLLFFTLAAVLPIVALGLIELSVFQRALPQREQEAMQNNLRLAELIASNLRYELNLVLDPVQKGAAADLVRLPRPAQDAALARLVSTTPLFRHLFLVDAGRRVRASAKPTLWLGQRLPEDVFPARTDSKPVHYSSVFLSVYDAAPLAAVAYAYPAYDRAALVSLLDLSAFEERVRTRPGSREQIVVVDQTGQALAHSEPQGVRTDDLGSLLPVKFVLQGRSGTVKYRQSVEGEPVFWLGAYTPIAGTGWGVVVGEVAADALRGPFTDLQSLGVGLTLTVLAAFGFAFWLSDRINQPLQRISAGMQQLAGGQESSQGITDPATALELQVLVDSFITMRERIRTETDANRQLLSGLVAEKGKLELVIEAIAEGVLVYDAEGGIVTANPALYALLGVNPAEFDDWRGLRLQDVLGEPVAVESTVLARAIQAGPLRELNRLQTLNGIRIIQTTAAPLRTGDGATVGGVAVIRDVTAQKESERLREDFVATLTHDLRTPLLAAVQTLSFALDHQYGELSSQQRQILAAVVESHRELLGLVESLLTIYQYEAGRIHLQKEPTDLSALIEQCLVQMQPLADARTQLLRLEAGQGLPQVPADRQQLRRVIINLIDNALKFTPAGGRVQVSLQHSPDESGVEVCVRDSGRGIPQDRLTALFTRFSKSGYSTGTGLGLYLCRQVIEAHGGRIWAVSQPGLGSAFHLVLPVEKP